ncbi:hypothetical protein BJY04DRAFT_231648 [Aspergillus karnatakaensis]|uniref:fungal specific transcription factor domain-containing protein n=1 Tax=Aspergillus karnatakaensis TaxID=1810916 RepID=UPI003CCD8407
MPRKHRPSRARETKACRACAAAKVRCETRNGTHGDGDQERSGACSRCFRLGRECEMQSLGAHKRVGNAPVSEGSKAPYAYRDAEDVPALLARLCEGIVSSLSEKEAQRILYTYQTQLSPYFPFVMISMDTSISDLRTRKPFLVSVIIMILSTQGSDPASQSEGYIDIAHRISEFITNSVVGRGSKSLDILQGLLVCLGWYHLAFEVGCQIELNTLIHIAVAMLGDLGLNKKPNATERAAPSLFGDISTEHGPGEWEGQRTLDERRAYLGVFYTSAMTSRCHGNMVAMRYTNYTEECCQAIEKAANTPIDLYPVRLARLSQSADALDSVISRNGRIAVPGYHSPPPLALIQTLEAELQHLKPPFPAITIHDSLLLLHAHHTEIILYRYALSEDFLTRHGSLPERTELLSHCLTATKAFLDVFASISPRCYINIPCPVFAAYSHALATASDLLLFPGENWDVKLSQSVLDLPVVVERTVSIIEESARTSSTQQPPYHFSKAFVKMIPRLRAFIASHHARSAALNDHTPAQPDEPDKDMASHDTLRDMIFQLPHGFSWRFLHPR